MRVTFVLDTFGGGGKERRCLQLVQGLNNNGIFNIQFIIINDKISYDEIYQTTAEVIVINRKKLDLSIWETYKILRKQLENFSPDIVQGWGYLSLFFLDMIRFSKKFIYIAAHVADANKPRGVERLINQSTKCLCDAIVGNSHAGLRAYGVPANKGYCFYNGYNQDRLNKIQNANPKDIRDEIGINTPYIVTMIARVDSNKDYNCFVEVARKVHSVRDDVTFLAVGKGDLLEFYRKETVSEEYIKFLGFRSDVEEILSITTVSLLCSNVHKHAEGISNAILESMAAGVPTIATLAGGTPEIIENNKNGFCIENNNVNEFTSKINLLLDNKQLYSSFAEACKSVVARKFSLEDSVHEYIQLYEALMMAK